MTVPLGAADIRWEIPDQPTSHEPPTLSAILHDIGALIRRYVVLTDDQAVVIALWVAHTHVLIEAFDCTPYLQITSATKRAGKTRLLEVQEPLVAKPWFTGRMSAAVLIRKMDAEHPTLLLDESDAAFNGDKEYGEALRGILNSGYRSSGKSSLCVGQGANISYKDFSTFGAKAIAGIGELPDTVADRAIRIELKRRTSDEPCQRWRERAGHEEATPTHRALLRWANQSGVVTTLRSARPQLPIGLSDRQADVWEPLLAIADLAGGDWPQRARSAAVTMSGSVEDTDNAVELLTDIERTLDEHPGEIITTKDLLDTLIAADDRPWATWRHDKPITARGLARLLGPLGIHPTRVERARGYRVDAFSDAFARYLPLQVGKRHSINKTGPESPISMCQPNRDPDAWKMRKEPDFFEEMTHSHIETGDEGEDSNE